jgi:ubiquitin-protein ligase
MQICAENGFLIYAAVGTLAQWRAFIPAPIPGANHAPVLWELAIVFRADYPYTAPVFRFLSVPPLKSVSALGRVRIRVVENYHPRFRVAALLKCIQNLFQTPEQIIPFAQDSRGDRIAWNPEDYDELIMAGTTDPWLPLPDLEYRRLIGGAILGCEVKAQPRKRKKAADLSLGPFSQLSWRRIVEPPLEVNGIVIAPDERKFFV